MVTSYKKATDGVGVFADGIYVPEDSTNKDWLQYQEDVSNGALIQDAAFSQSGSRANGKALVDRLAESERVAHIPVEPGGTFVTQLAYSEAADANAEAQDGTPLPADYPILAAYLEVKGSTIAAVATAVLSEEAAAKTALKAVEGVAAAAKLSIDSQTTQAGIDGVIASLVWP